MRAEISRVLRGEGALGPRADGFFQTVFHIGEIKVTAGNQVLLALPQNVFRNVTDDISRAVEMAVRTVMNADCRVLFVAKETLSQYAAEPAGAPEPVADKVPEPDVASIRSQAADEEETEPINGGEHVPEVDPYAEAASDPVIRDLISRGGQVTDVQILSEDE
jgi:hypothetical protein